MFISRATAPKSSIVKKHYLCRHDNIYTTFLPLLSAFSFASNTWFTKRNTERGRFSYLSAGNRKEGIYFIKNSL
jgi:hypothetical protein